jgi:hypothetical protein
MDQYGNLSAAGAKEDLVLDLRIFGENMMPKRGIVMFTWDELHREATREVLIGELPC